MNLKLCSKVAQILCGLSSAFTKGQPWDSPCPPNPQAIRTQKLLEPTTAPPLPYRFSLLSKPGYALKFHLATTGNVAVGCSSALQNRHGFRTPVLVTTRCCTCKCGAILPSERQGLCSGIQCSWLMDFDNKRAFGMNYTGTLAEMKPYHGEQTVLTLAFVNNPIDFNMKAWMSKSHIHMTTKKSRCPQNTGRVR